MDEASMETILVVDDTESNIDILVDVLDEKYDIRVALDGQSALEIAESEHPDLILLDIMMPGMDGYEVCRRLKRSEKTQDIPVIFVTSMGEVEDETRGFEVGAIDYIVKPISPPVVKSRVRSTLNLKKKTEQLEDLSHKLSKYLSPQVFESIFSGKQNARIESQRKKLTIFFSDIVGFTRTAERMEPEDMSNLLNMYLDEMAKIAFKYEGTVDKFVGDAIMVFFGDPESKGEKEDALSCVKMAMEMIASLKEMQKDWYLNGVIAPFRIRVGINTGFCTVGNFGSKNKMDYTIIGSQVNIAKRLEEVAQEDEIVISHETWSQIKDRIHCIKQKPVLVKGIPDPIQTYQVVCFLDQIKENDHNFPIGALVEQVPTITPDTLVRDIPLGRRLDDTFDAMVVVQEGEPIGLIMNYQLIRILDSHSHRAKFFDQPASCVMDASPLIVESNTSLEKVVQQTRCREPRKVYDHVIVTKEGRLAGSVPIPILLDKLAELHEEINGVSQESR